MKLIISLFALASLGLAVPACGKKEEPKPEPTKAATTEPTKPTEETKPAEADAAAAPADDAAAPTAAEEVAATEAAEVAVAADDAAAAEEIKPFLRVTVAHHDTAKPAVTAEFTTFTVVEAHTDLTKLDTAKAVIEVDLNSFSSGIPDRDTHIKGADFLDIVTSPKATVTVDRIKAGAAEGTYDATATVDLRGLKKEVPVTFKVVETKADGTLVVEGETKGLNRADWNMTKKPEEVNVGATFDVALRVELKETGTPVVPAAGTPEELFTKMTTHQEAVLALVEANKASPDAAAEAVEKYAAEHKDEIASLAAAMKLVPADQVEAVLKGAEEKVKALGERGAKLMTENPELMKSERFVKAMSALGGN